MERPSRKIQFVNTSVLRIAYYECGDPEGIPVILLHGFPYDVHAFDEVCRILTGTQSPSRFRVFVPWLRGYGETRFLSAETMRSGEQAALAADLLEFMQALQIPQAVLAGFDWGGRAACIVSALFPEKVLGLVSCGVGYNMHDPGTWQRPDVPEAEARAWYVYYFNTRRGKNALVEKPEELCRFLWGKWSPDWNFSEEEYQKSAESFRNPDFAEVVAHSYRCRIGETPGDERYRLIAEACGRHPDISVPGIVLLGEADGITPPSEEDRDAAHFTGAYERILLPHIGHNVPQEAPETVAEAICQIVSAGSGG